MTSRFDLVAHDCKRNDREREFVNRLYAAFCGGRRFARARELSNAIRENNE